MKIYQQLNIQISWFEGSDVITSSSTDKSDDFNRAWFSNGAGGGSAQ